MGGGHSKGKTSSKKTQKQQQQSYTFVPLTSDESDKRTSNQRSTFSNDFYRSSSHYQNCSSTVDRHIDRQNVCHPALLLSQGSKCDNSSPTRTYKSRTSSHVDSKVSAMASVQNEVYKSNSLSSTGNRESSSRSFDLNPVINKASAQFDRNDSKASSHTKAPQSGSVITSGPLNIEAREKSIRGYNYAPTAPVFDISNHPSYNRSLLWNSGHFTTDCRRSDLKLSPKLNGELSGSDQGENHKLHKNCGKTNEGKSKVCLPLGNNGSRPNQDADHRRSMSSNVGRPGEDPPKYEEIFEQPTSRGLKVLQNNKGDEKFQPPNASKTAKRPAEQVPGAQNGIKRLEELNERIRKQFGSVGGAIESLSNVDMSDKPFPVRNRLCIRNLPPNTTRNDLEELMSRYGEITVDFIDNDTRSCFLRVKQEAQAAQQYLHGFVFRGRTLRVRFDNRDVRFKVLNVEEWVTNELLKKAFSIFGEVERAEVFLDKDGRSIGEGYLEFANKNGGQRAYEACNEGCFVLTASLRPILLAKIHPDVGCRRNNENNGLKKNRHYIEARQVGPRFVHEGSSEYRFAVLWKELIEKRRLQQEELRKKFLEEEERICGQIQMLQQSDQIMPSK